MHLIYLLLFIFLEKFKFLDNKRLSRDVAVEDEEKSVDDAMSDDNSTSQSQFSEDEKPIEVKKTVVKRTKQVASKVILDPVGNVFFDELIKNYTVDSLKERIKDLITEWITQFEDDDESMYNMLNFVLYAAGADKNYLSADDNFDDLQDDELAEKLHDLASELVAAGMDYPIADDKSKKYSFRAKYSLFWTIFCEIIMKQMSDVDYSPNSIPSQILLNFIDRLINFSTMSIMNVRDSSTEAGVGIGKVMLKECLSLKLKLGTIKRQLIAQKQMPNSDGKENAKYKTFIGKEKRYDAALEELHNGCKNIFQSFLVHRMRDSNPSIRAKATQYIGDWLAIYPLEWCKDEYIKYLGWMCSDHDTDTRMEAILSIDRLIDSIATLPADAKAITTPIITNFVHRFISRFAAIVVSDVVPAISLAMIDLVRKLQVQQYLVHVKDDIIDEIDSGLFDPTCSLDVRKKIFLFFLDHAAGFESLADVATISPETTKKGKKQKESNDDVGTHQNALVQLETLTEFTNYHLQQDLQEVTTLAEVCLTSPVANILNDWSAIISLLLRDEGDDMLANTPNLSSTQFNSDQCNTLLRMFVYSAKQLKESTASEAALNKTEKQNKQRIWYALQEQLERDYSKLLSKFRDDTANLSCVLELLDCYEVIHEDSGTFKQFIKTIIEIFNSVSDKDIKKNIIIHGFRYWLSCTGDIANITESSIATIHSILWKNIGKSVSSLNDATSQDNDFESSYEGFLYTLSVTLERYSMLWKYIDIRDMMQEDVLDNVIETIPGINNCLLKVYPLVAETELGAICIKAWYDSIGATNALLLWLSNDVYKTAILKQNDLKPTNDEEMDESTGIVELEEQLNMFISCIIELRQKLVTSLSEIIMLRDKFDDEMHEDLAALSTHACSVISDLVTLFKRYSHQVALLDRIVFDEYSLPHEVIQYYRSVTEKSTNKKNKVSPQSKRATSNKKSKQNTKLESESESD